MMKYISLLFLVLSLSLVSCDKEELSSGDQFTFGAYAGECFGNCAQFFRVEDEAVYADNFDYWLGSTADLTFSNIPLSNDKYGAAVSFYESLPDKLMETPDTVFGQPDAYDQGGRFISLLKEGQLQYWIIDTNKEVLPDYLKLYMTEMDSVMNVMVQ